MPRRPPRCPDCSFAEALLIVYGEPDEELARRAERREVLLGGPRVSDDDPAWDCHGCGRRFGDTATPYNRLQRSVEEWLDLITTMLPPPVSRSKADELQAGYPVAVIVRVDASEITIMEARIEWCAHRPTLQGHPFAKVSLRAPASRVAKLIASAWGKRISRYEWCPRCQRRVDPEHTLASGICHGCATAVLGIVF